MLEDITICNISIQNIGIEEIMRNMRGFFLTRKLDVVEFVDSDVLRISTDNEELHNDISASELIIIRDKTVTKVLEGEYALNEEDIETSKVLIRTLTYMIQHQKTVYWIGEDEDSYNSFMNMIDRRFPAMRIDGAIITDSNADNEEMVINEINKEAPDVILSRLSSPYQESFVQRNKNMINASLWLGIGGKTIPGIDSIKPRSRIKSIIDKTLLKRADNTNEQ